MTIFIGWRRRLRDDMEGKTKRNVSIIKDADGSKSGKLNDF